VRFLGFAALIGFFLFSALLLRRRLTQCPLKENLIRTDRPDVTNSSLKAAAPALRYLATPSSLFVDLLPTCRTRTILIRILGWHFDAVAV